MRLPAACAPLLLVLVLYVAVQASPAALWSQGWGKQKSTGACEPLQEASAVREPINAWSNLAYGVCGAIALTDALADRKSRGLAAGHLRSAPEVSVLFGVSWLALSACSFLWHAANVRGWQHADVGATLAATLCLTGWSVCSVCLYHWPSARRHPRLCRGATVSLVLLLDALFAAYKWQLELTELMVGAMSVLVLVEGGVQPALAARSWRHRLLVAGAALAFGGSYCFRQAEAKKFFGLRKPLCLHSAWFQPHAVWHLGTALAIALLHRAWRLPLPPDCVRGWARRAGLDAEPEATDGAEGGDLASSTAAEEGERQTEDGDAAVGAKAKAAPVTIELAPATAV